MELKVKKTVTAKIDTALERKRIKEGWDEGTQEYDRLNTLMDHIEGCNWKAAYEELSSDWWKEKDEELECSRLEFIGEINYVGNDGFKCNIGFSYDDLVWSFYHHSDKYTVFS